MTFTASGGPGCRLRMLAVGGGGDCGGSGNGGGSGYIPYMDTPLEETFRNLTIQVAVGRGGQPSEIAIDHAVKIISYKFKKNLK